METTSESTVPRKGARRKNWLGGECGAASPICIASVDEDTTLQELIQRLGQPKQWRGRRVRALRPFGDDSTFLEAANRVPGAARGGSAGSFDCFVLTV
jgi:hypothetical protein